jgi:hypothetical protein
MNDAKYLLQRAADVRHLIETMVMAPSVSVNCGYAAVDALRKAEKAIREAIETANCRMVAEEMFPVTTEELRTMAPEARKAYHQVMHERTMFEIELAGYVTR